MLAASAFNSLGVHGVSERRSFKLLRDAGNGEQYAHAELHPTYQLHHEGPNFLAKLSKRSSNKCCILPSAVSFKDDAKELSPASRCWLGAREGRHQS